MERKIGKEKDSASVNLSDILELGGGGVRPPKPLPNWIPHCITQQLSERSKFIGGGTDNNIGGGTLPEVVEHDSLISLLGRGGYL